MSVHPDDPHTEREAALMLDLTEAQAKLAEKDAEIYVPGGWHCAKCGFQLIKSTLSPRGLGIDLSQETEPCPNDGEPMRRDTWKRDAMSLANRLSDALQAVRLAEQSRDALIVINNQQRAQMERQITLTAQWRDCAEYGWSVIANAGGGNWLLESPDWREAAARFRDQCYYPAIKADRAGWATRPTVQPPKSGRIDRFLHWLFNWKF